MLNKFANLRSALFTLPFTANFTSSPRSSMGLKMKNIPDPTVPSAINARAQLPTESAVETAYFANGCFWGTEHEFASYFSKLPNFKVEVGYTGGNAVNPTYRQVCSGTTGHAEGVKIEFDRSTLAYAELCEFFFRTHDPTTVNQQGNDRGSQYRSAIFTTTPEQATIAQQVRDEVQEKYFSAKGKKIVTQLATAGPWYKAEDSHQEYLLENPGGYQCSNHRLWW